MKKIGIVTWYWGNYGSILQAYALQKAVELKDYDCEIIRHCVNGTKVEQIKYRISHEGIKSIHYFANKAIGRSDARNSEDRRKRDKVLDKFVEENLVLSTKKYDNSNYSECTAYDCYICGSDQIWNPSYTFFSPFYWLGFVPDGKTRIAYAPSMGNGSLHDRDKELIRGYLEKYKAISLREEKSVELIRDIVPKAEVVATADPTMLLKKSLWESAVPERSVKDRYLFAYIIRGNKEQREFVTSIAKHYGLKLVVYPYLEVNKIEADEMEWGDIRCFEDDPFDFLGKIYHADMIVTDSFHCSVFSLLFHKDFYVLKKVNDNTRQFLRLEQLLGRCGVINRIIDTDEKFKMQNSYFDEVDAAIEILQKKSLMFLESALLQ